MSKLFSRIARFFGNRTPMGVDKAGNRYFARKEEIDGVNSLNDKSFILQKPESESPVSVLQPAVGTCKKGEQNMMAKRSD
ncbi:hypothetical protein L484_000609 [Morus notabilis]|uniref:NADH dehydrogenase [ubiquinone] 1 alpha subcomplex subunit 12 n=1 Tax=Morus notabilis TaxID=981085 RepID=W9SEC9_9ROSA|nr:hypothetical protein L484_000609 [Morus notabilis]